MISRPTPSSVLYADLKQFGKINNKDAAFTLLSPKIGPGGRIARDYVTQPVYLSRSVVNVTPEHVDPGNYGNLCSGSQTLYKQVLNHAGGPQAQGDVLAHYSEDAAQKMIAALTQYNRNAQLYRNELTRLMQAQLLKESDRALLVFRLFCITGCLADPEAAIQKVEDFANDVLVQDLATVSTASSRGPEHAVSATFGLMRKFDNVLRPPFFPLDPEGSRLGCFAAGPHDIADVGADVSRQHARVWLEDGRWLCEDLESTNGTFIMRGTDDSLIEVAPPRNRRKKDINYPPQELHENDILRLGSNTSFFFLREPVLE